MPHISTFVYCEGFQIDNPQIGQQPKLHIVGPMHVLTPQFVPTTFSFGLFFGILDFNMGEEHKVRVTFLSPKVEDKLLLDTGDIVLPPNKIDTVQDMQGFMMNLDLRNMVIEYNGEYKSEIYLDGEKIGTYPIKVKGMNGK